MSRRLVVDVPAWQVWVGAGTLVATGALVAAGVWFGGYAFGQDSVAADTTAPVERVYTADDLRAAAADCGVQGGVVAGSTLSMPSADYASYSRQCVVAALDAPPRAEAEYSAAIIQERFQLDGGEYAWSNIAMSWKQTDDGRDLTMTVETP